jgi:hypothetical protein
MLPARMSDEHLYVLILVVVGAVVAVNILFVVREWRRLNRLPRSSPPTPTRFGLGGSPDGVGDFLGSLMGCLFFAVVALVGLFVIVWIVKRMWEAA